MLSRAQNEKKGGWPPKKGSLGLKKTTDGVRSNTVQGSKSQALLERIRGRGRQSTALKISQMNSNLWGRLKRTLIVQFAERFLDPLSRQSVSTIFVQVVRDKR